jgi:hypothetical protein
MFGSFSAACAAAPGGRESGCRHSAGCSPQLVDAAPRRTLMPSTTACCPARMPARSAMLLVMRVHRLMNITVEPASSRSRVKRLGKRVGRKCRGIIFDKYIDADGLIRLRRAVLRTCYVASQQSIGGTGEEKAREFHFVRPYAGPVCVVIIVGDGFDEVVDQERSAFR